MVLVVPQQDVVARLVALDEVVLEGERLHLGVGDHEVEVRDLRDTHVAALRVDGAAGLEIRPHAVAEHTGLADVEDLALGVLEQCTRRDATGSVSSFSVRPMSEGSAPLRKTQQMIIRSLRTC